MGPANVELDTRGGTRVRLSSRKPSSASTPNEFARLDVDVGECVLCACNGFPWTGNYKNCEDVGGRTGWSMASEGLSERRDFPPQLKLGI